VFQHLLIHVRDRPPGAGSGDQEETRCTIPFAAASIPLVHDTMLPTPSAFLDLAVSTARGTPAYATELRKVSSRLGLSAMSPLSRSVTVFVVGLDSNVVEDASKFACAAVAPTRPSHSSVESTTAHSSLFFVNSVQEPTGSALLDLCTSQRLLLPYADLTLCSPQHLAK
jgi:hypothetical protein